ncbi:ADP-ribosylation factor-like protein 2 [Enteropsectra breve]|nr:ADP-ribosylation factor-like protein 2 [Enteropsectra breve]
MAFVKLVEYVKRKSKDLRIIVIGHDNAGKTTLLKKYLGIEGQTAPTFGYQIYTSAYKSKDETINISFLDIGGQQSFKKYWNNYFEDTAGAIFVIDAAGERPISEYFNEIYALGIPICILINKIDMNPDFNMDMLKNQINGGEIGYYKVCALENNDELSKGIEWLISRALSFK